MSEAEVVTLRGPGRPPKQTVEEVAAELNEMVDQLLKENRRLRRQIQRVLSPEEDLAGDDLARIQIALRRLHRKMAGAIVS